MAFRVGDRCGRLVLTKPLGRGGMAEVFLAEDLETGGRYAVKTVIGGSDRELQLRFRREAEAQASADAHPNVLKIHSWHEDPRGSYVVMEYAAGGDLKDRLRAGALAPEEVVLLVRDLALGLEHVHGVGVLHRDLKPANVLFDEHGTPKLADFGLARIADASSLTETGALLGTPAYMSPEQAKGRGVDVRSDVYGLGAILYACLTGFPPFTGSSPLVILSRVVKDLPQLPSRCRPGIPGPVEAVCMRALAKAPEERYPSAAALADALAGGVKGARPGRPSVPRWGLGLAAVSCLLLTSVAVWPRQPDPGLARVADSPGTVGDPIVRTEATAPPSVPKGPALRFLPDLAEANCPKLEADELEKLEAWRIAFGAGSWALLGRRLDPHRSADSRGLRKDADQSLYCYFKAWEEGDLSGMGSVARRFVEVSAANRAIGFELGWRAGVLGDVQTQLRLARSYSPRAVKLGKYRGWLAPGDRVCGAWLVLARASGAPAREIQKGTERSGGVPLPASLEQAHQILRKAREGAKWRQDGLFRDAPLALPSPRERVALLLRRHGVVDAVAIRRKLIGADPSQKELSDLADQRLELGYSTWYFFGKSLDPGKKSVTDVHSVKYKAAMRKALICYFEAMREGDRKPLVRLGRYLCAGDALPQDAPLGLLLLRWAGVGGDVLAYGRLAKRNGASLQEKSAWTFLLEGSEEADKIARPETAEEAWGWIAEALRTERTVKQDEFPEVVLTAHGDQVSLFERRLSVQERAMLANTVNESAMGWLELGGRMDPRFGGKGKQTFLGQRRDIRLARVCYARAMQAGSAGARYKLAKSLLDPKGHPAYGARKLGFDLVLAEAVADVSDVARKAQRWLEREYSRDADGTVLEAPVRYDPAVASAWAALGNRKAADSDVGTHQVWLARAASWRWVNCRSADEERAWRQIEARATTLRRSGQ